MASFDYITKNRGSTTTLFSEIDDDELLDLDETKISNIKQSRNLNNIDHYLHTNALNKNTLRNSYIESGKDRNLVSENSIPATYSDKSRNKFLKPIRFIETLRNYLGDIFEKRDIFVKDNDTKLSEFFKKLSSLDDEKVESIRTKKGISREFSDDLVIYYIFNILEKLQNVDNPSVNKENNIENIDKNKLKARIMVRFLYIVAFYGIKVLDIEEYKKLIEMHPTLEAEFTKFFEKNENVATNALDKRGDFIGLQCKTFVEENLCGKIQPKYSKRTNMYRLFSSMQRCIYDDGDNASKEMKNVLNDLGEKCEKNSETSIELSKKGETLCSLITRMKDCNFDEPLLKQVNAKDSEIAKDGENAENGETVVSDNVLSVINKEKDIFDEKRKNVFGQIPIKLPLSVDKQSNQQSNGGIKVPENLLNA